MISRAYRVTLLSTIVLTPRKDAWRAAAEQVGIGSGRLDGGAGRENRAANLGGCWTALMRRIHQCCQHRWPDCQLQARHPSFLPNFPPFHVVRALLLNPWATNELLSTILLQPVILPLPFLTALFRMAAPSPKSQQGLGSCAQDPGKASSRMVRGWAGKVPAGYQECKLSLKRGREEIHRYYKYWEVNYDFFCCCCLC